MIASYLDKDRRRSAVVLGGLPRDDRGTLGELTRAADGRMIMVAASPAAAELRDAIVAAGRGAMRRSQEE